jgi:hypothetical protein
VTGIAPALALVIALSSHAAGAHARLSLRATFELQCGWPGPSLVVTFPARVAPTAVLVDGKAPGRVTRSGSTVTLTVSRPQVLCDSIGPGAVRVVFTDLRNPARSGRYRLALRHGGQTASGAFSIR